jgi:hypothetical protein
MFRKLLLSAIVAVGCAVPFAAAPKVEAEPFVHRYYYHHHRYRVFYRASPYEPWILYGRFEHFARARHVAHELRERGFQAFVE